MFTLKIENAKKQIIELTNNESDYQITNVEGLQPPKAEIYMSNVANLDGEKFKSSKLSSRNVVLTINLNGDVEDNRQRLYNFFKCGGYCKIYFKNAKRNIYIEGYCETIENELFSNAQYTQVSILCPQPYLNDIEVIINDISKVKRGFSFPFSVSGEGVAFSSLKSNLVTQIFYDGELSTGLVMKFFSKGDGILNPTVFNTDTGNFFRVETVLNKNDELIINTNKGNKSVTVIRNGISENAINFISGSSTWLQLESGYNNFTYNSDSNDELLEVTLEYNNKYEGV